MAAPHCDPIILLGSTGSIGQQTLAVAAEHGLQVRALACGSDVERLAAQMDVWRPELVAVADRDAAARLRATLAHGPLASIGILEGEEGVRVLAALDGAAIVVQAMVGLAGIGPALAALDAGHDLALANKEVLVSAGPLVERHRRAAGARLLPIDSEHSALWQALEGGRPEALRRVILTASGGPFRGRTRAQLAEVSVAEALAHPTWAMGGKISIDSATMMNKGLEMIEAARLFALEAQQIDVVIHPQSIIHSMIEWCDGSVIAQLSQPDMRLPIQYALGYPERWPSPARRFDPLAANARQLDFEGLDEATFPATALARACLERGGAWPLALNAANEVAVAAFLAGELSFLGIAELVEAVLDAPEADWDGEPDSLEAVLERDREARRLATARL